MQNIHNLSFVIIMEFVVIQLLYLCRLGCELYAWKHFHARHLPSTTPWLPGRRSGVHINVSCSMQRSMSKFCQCYYEIIKCTLVFCVHSTCLTCNKIGFRSEWMIIWSAPWPRGDLDWSATLPHIAECDAGMHYTRDVIIELKCSMHKSTSRPRPCWLKDDFVRGKCRYSMPYYVMVFLLCTCMIIYHNNF